MEMRAVALENQQVTPLNEHRLYEPPKRKRSDANTHSPLKSGICPLQPSIIPPNTDSLLF
eukprot:885203-Amorphochlora_amoeboformis.AAC.1